MNSLKRSALKIVSISLFLFCILTSCIPLKSLYLGHPDANDASRFKNKDLISDSCFSFQTSNKIRTFKVTDWTTDKPRFRSIFDVLKEHSVRAFILIQNDTVKAEYYRNDLNKSSIHPSYSLAKSFVSCLIGIAIDEGHIHNVNQQVQAFIPEISLNERGKTLTIKDLLNHTSGIKFSITQDARLYYGKNLSAELEKIEFSNVPGQTQEYSNINTQLLGVIIKRSTGMSVSEYAQKKLWNPINMCNIGKWSVDNLDVEKSFCCLSATALDYAKFGRLYLNKGQWEGKRIYGEDWYDQSIKRDTTQGSSFNYNYSWHIGLKEYEDYAAIGLYKQQIYVSQKKKIVIVLLNDRENKLKAERINWWFIFRQLVDQL
ncbi:beta-lactamase family protein [Crocinitomicaceae bacterium]|nr:beta-lactamase family protein [Crocinitomicaceae bacterium]